MNVEGITGPLRDSQGTTGHGQHVRGRSPVVKRTLGGSMDTDSKQGNAVVVFSP